MIDKTIDIPTAGGMQQKFKTGILMRFTEGKIEWYLDDNVWNNIVGAKERFEIQMQKDLKELEDYNNSLKN